MKKTLIGLGLSLIIKIALVSGSDFKEGLLWKVTGIGLEHPSYIFGTLHIICPEEFTVFPGTVEMLDQSEQLVLELDLSDPSLLLGIQMGMFMKDNTELGNIVTEEEMELLSSFFIDSLSMDINFLARIQPFFLSTMLYPHMLKCFPKSYEQFFLDQAKEREMDVIGLETLEEQLHVFEALTYREQADLFIEILTEYNEKRRELREMLDLYLATDLQGLNKIFEDTSFENEEFNRRLLQDRNHRWIGRMEELMLEKPTFFALGAGHLPGDEGILQLLVDRGYVLEKVGE
jgi:uncharacterized protein